MTLDLNSHELRRWLIGLARFLVQLEEYMVERGELRPERRTRIVFAADEKKRESSYNAE